MEEEKIYKKARSSKGWCEICGHFVNKGDYFTTSGPDGHGALTGLTHKDCIERSSK